MVIEQQQQANLHAPTLAIAGEYSITLAGTGRPVPTIPLIRWRVLQMFRKELTARLAKGDIGSGAGGGYWAGTNRAIIAVFVHDLGNYSNWFNL